MKYARALAILVFGSVLACAFAGCTWSLLLAVLPTPGPAFAIAGGAVVVGVLISLVVAVKSLSRRETYDRCPACAFDVRAVGAGVDGKIRCPACGQWLGGKA